MDTEINWDDVIKKEARGIDDLDLGEVQDVSEDKVVVQKGIIEKNVYQYPKVKSKAMMEKSSDLIFLKVK